MQINIQEHLNAEYGFQISIEEEEIGAETRAAIGASLSRDPGSLKQRTENMSFEKRERLIGKYFNKYGHSSIGEMGDLSISVEGISMLGAVNTITFPRFRGQEASTRYISWNMHDFLLPKALMKSDKAKNIVRELFDLYSEVSSILMAHFKKQGMSDAIAKPKALDIAGGFLPGAAKTNVTISCDIRNSIEQAWNLQSMLDNEEAREIGNHLLFVIDKICPNSVKRRTKDELKEVNELRRMTIRGLRYGHDDAIEVDFKNFDATSISPVMPTLLNARLQNDGLKKHGIITATFPISFRSLRDCLRHRVFGKQWDLFKPVTMTEWYLKQIPKNYQKRIETRVSDLISRAKKVRPICQESQFPLDFYYNYDLLYLLPMGCRTTLEMSGDINAWIYFLNLRSGKRVHPEVRNIVQNIIAIFSKKLKINEEKLGDMTKEADYVQRSKDA